MDKYTEDMIKTYEQTKKLSEEREKIIEFNFEDFDAFDLLKKEGDKIYTRNEVDKLLSESYEIAKKKIKIDKIDENVRKIYCPICGDLMFPDVGTNVDDWNKEYTNGEWQCGECESDFCLFMVNYKGGPVLDYIKDKKIELVKIERR